ncbi:hypothetical protein [Acidovorax sp. NCPPB 4044]|uniref:hypothetical protein n=1 Tax=Acidovorax sp. NCPPB 4044 TaxID=2940490 RepID=UPI00230342D0|nr:hypothetical protein [Acidovorax sp. NCPPB 4044]MDA8522269.1 hypothetical protein [Acidovorax sp. NCPPB 4044]
MTAAEAANKRVRRTGIAMAKSRSTPAAVRDELRLTANSNHHPGARGIRPNACWLTSRDGSTHSYTVSDANTVAIAHASEVVTDTRQWACRLASQLTGRGIGCA